MDMMVWPAGQTADERLADIRASNRQLVIPPNFDPLAADDQTLARIGLPPRPNRDTERELHDFWMEMFSPPLTFEDVQFDLALPRAYYTRGSGGSTAVRSRHESSLNWSGAYIAPRDGRKFVQVVGSWKVPTVSVPPGGNPGAEYGSSTWIGLDGQREYIDSTLPQIGTGQFFNLMGLPGTTYESWVQWWPNCPFTVGMPVKAGDKILAWLYVITPTEVVMIIKNQDAGGPAYPWVAFSPTVIKSPQYPTPIKARVSGATAEWVMERPAIPMSTVLFNLPQYTPVTFTSCLAATEPPAGGLQRMENIVSPRLLHMYRTALNPHRRVTISDPTRLGPDSFKTEFRV